MKEFDILNTILPMLHQRSDVKVGPGDDCAAIDIGETYLLAAADQMIYGLHYYPHTTPDRIGRKLLKRNLSDIAAMGGTPSHALVSLASTSDKLEWFEKFFRGMEKEARKWNVSICGGDLAGLPRKALREVMSLTILGKVAPDKICLRSSALNGDVLYATGCFGNSLESQHHLRFVPRLAEGRFVAGKYTRAMIDVSDGLVLDASRMAKASKLALKLDIEAIPLRPGADLPRALSDGEDYELLFAVRPDLCETLERKWRFATRLTRIGYFESGSGVYDLSGNNLLTGKIGYEHQCG